MPSPHELPRRSADADAFARLAGIVQVLRSPEGCPWDREQSPRSLTGGLIEEAYECVEAITEGTHDEVREELGDLFLLATMISYMHEQEAVFSLEEVLRDIGDKLIRRHPHVFGDAVVADSTEVISAWNRIKVEVEGKREKNSVLDGIPRSLPPLSRAQKLQSRAKKIGFDWPDREPIHRKLDEEVQELADAIDSGDPDAMEAEVGDILFTVVNIARHLNVDAATALHRANERFSRRFRYVEDRHREAGEDQDANAPNEGLLARLEAYWQDSKRRTDRV